MNLENIKKTFQYSRKEKNSQKVIISKWICYLAILFLSIFSYIAWTQELIFYSILQIFCILSTLINIFLFKKMKNSTFLIFNINFTFSIFLSYMMFTGGTGQNTGIVWFQVFPIIAFAINGLVWGIYMNLFYITLALVTTIFTDLPFVTHQYPEDVVYSFYGVLFFIISASFVSEYSRVRAHMHEEEYRDILLDISTKDELTGTYNRRHMNEEIQYLFDNRYDFSLAFADIDNFKKINDTYGHDVGDEVIKQVSNAFQDSLRNDDYLARWGGEEFVLVFKDTPIETARTIVERIRKHIERIEIDVGNRQKINITCSFGIEHSSNLNKQDDLISKADNKLYQAKNTGKNIVVS